MKMKLMTTFVIDFGSILGAFWEHFWSFFGAFLELKMYIRKYVYLKTVLERKKAIL